MKNNKKIKVLLNIVSVLVIMFMACDVVYGDLGKGFNEGIFDVIKSDMSEGSIGISGYKAVVTRVLGTIFVILKILACAGVVLTGVKYMLAGAESKGKLKQTLIWVVIGTMFVFGAEAIVEYVAKSGLEIVG